MGQSNKIITIALIFLLGVFLQVLFVFADMQDTPNRAAIEFAKAYFRFDKCMADRLCDERKVVDDKDVVSKYVYDAAKDANDLGYGLFYMKNKLYHVETHTISKDHEKAQIRLTCERRAPLRSFFTKEEYKDVEEVLDLVKENGKWKVCGNPFALPQG